jgi:hypothetical protein
MPSHKNYNKKKKIAQQYWLAMHDQIDDHVKRNSLEN